MVPETFLVPQLFFIMTRNRYLMIISAFLCLSLILTSPIHLYAQLSSTVTCLFPKSWEGRQALLVAQPLAQRTKLDTAVVLNRMAVFTIDVAEPCPAYIWVEGNKDDIPFFIDSPRIDISIDPTSSTHSLVVGSPGSDLWVEQLYRSNDFQNTDRELSQEIAMAMVKGDTIAASQLENQIDSLRIAQTNALIKQILNHPDLSLSWYTFATNDFAYDQTYSLFDKLGAFSSYPSYKRLSDKLTRKKLGITVQDFATSAHANSPVNLSSLKSRFILLDFSMTYMLACKRQHTLFRNLYTNYKSSGLEIITIWSAQEKNSQNNLPWIQILNNELSKTLTHDLAVDRVPDNVLLDSNRRVIARGLTMHELEAKLAQLLNE